MRWSCTVEGGRSDATSFYNFILISSAYLLHLCGGKISASEKILSNHGNQALSDLSFVHLFSACWALGPVLGTDWRSTGDLMVSAFREPQSSSIVISRVTMSCIF